MHETQYRVREATELHQTQLSGMIVERRGEGGAQARLHRPLSPSNNGKRKLRPRNAKRPRQTYGCGRMRLEISSQAQERRHRLTRGGGAQALTNTQGHNHKSTMVRMGRLLWLCIGSVKSHTHYPSRGWPRKHRRRSGTQHLEPAISILSVFFGGGGRRGYLEKSATHARVLR